MPTEEEMAAAAAAAAAKEAEEAAAAAKAAEEAEAAAKAAEAEKNKTSEADAAALAAEVARLTAEAEEAKAEAAKLAAKFKGVDPDVARENAKKIAEAEAAAREAEKAKASAEGNFERLRELQKEEFEAEKAALLEAKTAAEQKAEAAQAALDKQIVSTAFAASKFLSEETVLSPAKAERLFSEFVDIEEGKLVVYDAPRGADKRVKIMDARGNAVSFNDAIRKVIEADEDKDSLLRSKLKPGAGSKTEESKTTQPVDRLSKLSAGIAALRK